ncbi:hypothetical protein FN846DRAFT_988893 [Sphaerosporella brunnea]|uniref:Uncharacterized protein n=1 Tax=Sphaerosporella brunnea TaxID=1250544 RepID=A0A5J5ERG2_9PEZI|nr:hypothetical protein FN846DRAFT_988893 [Sphaerosporella brunnea]
MGIEKVVRSRLTLKLIDDLMQDNTRKAASSYIVSVPLSSGLILLVPLQSTTTKRFRQLATWCKIFIPGGQITMESRRVWGKVYCKTLKLLDESMDEPTLWHTLLVTCLHDPYPGDVSLEKSFGLHDVAKPYGWYRVAGGDMNLRHCQEGYFAFDRGCRHTMLVAETEEGVMKLFDDGEDVKTAGNWQRGGEPYDRNAGDQCREYWC